MSEITMENRVARLLRPVHRRWRRKQRFLAWAAEEMAGQDRLAAARRLARDGVLLSRMDGCRCPMCGAVAHLVRELPAKDGLRRRVHRCDRHGCALAEAGVPITSWEVVGRAFEY